jgi:hypothetical protein
MEKEKIKILINDILEQIKRMKEKYERYDNENKTVKKNI